MTEQETAYEMETKKPEMSIGLYNSDRFDFLQRVAKMLSTSTLVPEQYRAVDKRGKVNPSGLANCVVALNMASRMKADELMIMQNLYIIEGRPAWSSQFVISQINSCKQFSPVRFVISEKGEEQEVEYPVTKWANGNKTVTMVKVMIQNQTCFARTTELATGEELKGPEVSILMAVQEGWYGKNGSKWQTMPEVMLRYRAAGFFGRLYCPELLMGIRSEEETREIVDLTPDASGTYGPKVDINDKINAAAAEKKEEMPGKPLSSENLDDNSNGTLADSSSQDQSQPTSQGSQEESQTAPPPWHPDNHKRLRWQGLVTFAASNFDTWPDADKGHQENFMAKWADKVGTKAACPVAIETATVDVSGQVLTLPEQGALIPEGKDEDLEPLTGQAKTGKTSELYGYMIDQCNTKISLNEFVTEYKAEIDEREDSDKVWDLVNARLERISVE